jgi:hypothetical protein
MLEVISSWYLVLGRIYATLPAEQEIIANRSRALPHLILGWFRQMDLTFSHRVRSQITALRLAGTLFGIFCLVHVWRLLAGFDVVIGQHHIPAAASVFAAVVTGALSVWFWKLSFDQS